MPVLTSKPPSLQDWATPRRIFAAIHDEYRFVLDAAAEAHNTKCDAFYTEAQDGLEQPWPASTWCNPPYKSIDEWVRKALRETKAHGSIACLLVPGSTDTDWFHLTLLRGEAQLFKGRIQFEPPPGVVPCNGSPITNTLLVFGTALRGVTATRNSRTGERIRTLG